MLVNLFSNLPTFPWIIPYALIHTQGDPVFRLPDDAEHETDTPPPLPLLSKQADLLPVSDTCQHKEKNFGYMCT